MALIGKDDLTVGLKVISTFATGIYAGGAWFLQYGSIPAARSLKPSCCLKVTKAVFKRCLPMAATAVVAALGPAGVYYMSRGGKKDERAWLAVACAIGAIHPYTLYFLLPINMRVLNDDIPEEEAYSTVDNWRNLHLWRTLAASGCFLLLSYELAK